MSGLSLRPPFPLTRTHASTVGARQLGLLLPVWGLDSFRCSCSLVSAVTYGSRQRPGDTERDRDSRRTGEFAAPTARSGQQSPGHLARPRPLSTSPPRPPPASTLRPITSPAPFPHGTALFSGRGVEARQARVKLSSLPAPQRLPQDAADVTPRSGTPAGEQDPRERERSELGRAHALSPRGPGEHLQKPSCPFSLVPSRAQSRTADKRHHECGKDAQGTVSSSARSGNASSPVA